MDFLLQFYGALQKNSLSRSMMSKEDVQLEDILRKNLTENEAVQSQLKKLLDSPDIPFDIPVDIPPDNPQPSVDELQDAGEINQIITKPIPIEQPIVTLDDMRNAGIVFDDAPVNEQPNPRLVEGEAELRARLEAFQAPELPPTEEPAPVEIVLPDENERRITNLEQQVDSADDVSWPEDSSEALVKSPATESQYSDWLGILSVDSDANTFRLLWHPSNTSMFLRCYNNEISDVTLTGFTKIQYDTDDIFGMSYAIESDPISQDATVYLKITSVDGIHSAEVYYVEDWGLNDLPAPSSSVNEYIMPVAYIGFNDAGTAIDPDRCKSIMDTANVGWVATGAYKQAETEIYKDESEVSVFGLNTDTTTAWGETKIYFDKGGRITSKDVTTGSLEYVDVARSGGGNSIRLYYRAMDGANTRRIVALRLNSF